MTAPPHPSVPLLSVEQYAGLPEDGEIRHELQEGILVMSPSRMAKHQICQRRLGSRLECQLPADLEVIPEVDIDLQLVRPNRPGFVRRPDLVMVTRSAVERVDREGGLLRASEVRLVIEIISPSTRRMDTVIKHAEYADAGIGHYWMVDLLDGPSLTACHRAGAFGYSDASPVTGAFTTDQPFPVRLDLAEQV